MLRLNFQPSKKFSLQDSRLYQNIHDIPIAGNKTDVIERIMYI